MIGHGLLIVGQLLAAAMPVEATSLSGTTLRGELVAFAEDRVEVKTDQGPQSIPTRDLLEVRWPEVATTDRAAEGEEIRLADGSTLRATVVSLTGGKLRLRHALLGEIELAQAGVRGIRFGASDPAVDAAWTALFERPSRSDQVVIRKADVLDHLDGVISNIGDETIGFLLDGQTVAVKKTRAFGILFGTPSDAPQPVQDVRIELASGERFTAQKVALERQPDGEWMARVTAPFQVDIPSTALRGLDWSRGKIAYVSDLEPRGVDYRPFLGNFVWEYRRNQDLEGRPLRLKGRVYSRGLAIHANAKTELTYRIGGEYRRLQATVGIDDEFRLRNVADFKILGDGKVLFEHEVSPEKPPAAVDLDVTDVVELKIIAECGNDRLDIGDRIHLVDARLLK
ncbi:MAG: NPCBM/NEW2 domain-containing protein [Planctomycetaceae bacterium]|nr:NPCBM/NEW2 domain-containing protein [Planctomycetaceae bacterium]